MGLLQVVTWPMLCQHKRVCHTATKKQARFWTFPLFFFLVQDPQEPEETVVETKPKRPSLVIVIDCHLKCMTLYGPHKYKGCFKLTSATVPTFFASAAVSGLSHSSSHIFISHVHHICFCFLYSNSSRMV
jgi:hypothetical protein